MAVGKWVHYAGQNSFITIQWVQCDAKINIQYSFIEDINDIGWIEKYKVTLQ